MAHDSAQGDTLFWYHIPHIASFGDSLAYYIAATDNAQNRNTSGLYTFRVSETGIEEHTSRVEKKALCDLHQINPNPFKSSTVINYSITTPCRVTLKVYNILGKLVTTLINERKLTGTHNVRWDGKDANGRQVPSGIYFSHLEAGDQVNTRQLILLK
jgi:hypothetical protein